MAQATTKTQVQELPGANMTTAPADNLPAPRPRTQVNAIVPTSWQEIATISAAICRAGMAPKSYLDQNGVPVPEKVAVAIMHGMEVGMTPMAALQSIAVINGMPGLYGDGMLAVVRASGLLEDFIETDEWDDKGPLVATCRVKRRGEATWGEMKCARDDAQKAGWWDKAGPWKLTPHRMLQMRARGWALRDKFADVLRGLRSAEEVQDMVDVTPQGSATTAEPAPEPKRADYEPKPQPQPPTPPSGETGQQSQAAAGEGAAKSGQPSPPGPGGNADGMDIPAALDRRPKATQTPVTAGAGDVLTDLRTGRPITNVTDVTDENDNPFGATVDEDDIPFAGDQVTDTPIDKDPRYDDPAFKMPPYPSAKPFMTAFEEFVKLPECGPKNAQRWLDTYDTVMKAIYSRRSDAKFKEMAEFLDTLAGMLDGVIAKGKA